MTDLTTQLKEAIDKTDFNTFELTGFKTNPMLALMAGAAIGYRLATEHFQQELDKSIYKQSGD